MVAEDAEKQSNEVPDSHKDAIVSPIASSCDELGPKYGRAEWKNCEYDEADVFAAFLDGHYFGRAGESNQFIETSSETRENLARFSSQNTRLRKEVLGIPMAIFIVCAVAVIIGPTMRKSCPTMATFCRP